MVPIPIFGRCMYALPPAPWPPAPRRRSEQEIEQDRVRQLERKLAKLAAVPAPKPPQPPVAPGWPLAQSDQAAGWAFLWIIPCVVAVGVFNPMLRLFEGWTMLIPLFGLPFFLGWLCACVQLRAEEQRRHAAAMARYHTELREHPRRVREAQVRAAERAALQAELAALEQHP